MTMSPGQAIFQEIALFLAPLQESLRGPREFRNLLRALGYHVHSLENSIDDIRKVLALGDALDTLGNLASKETLSASDLDEIARVIKKTWDAVNALKDLQEVSQNLSGRLRLPGFWQQFGDRLAGYLLANYLRWHQPPLYAVSRFTGVLDTYTEDDGLRTTAIERIDWDQLNLLLTDPAQAIANRYNWGGSLAFDLFAADIADGAAALGIRTERVSPASDLDQTLYGPGAPGAQYAIRIPFYRGKPARGLPYIEMGMLIQTGPIDTEDGPVSGALVFAPYASGEIAGRLEFGNSKSLQLEYGAAGEVSGKAYAHMSPSRGMVLESLPGAAGAGLTFLTELQKTGANGKAIVVLGDADGTNLSFDRFMMRLEMLEGDFRIVAGGEGLKACIDIKDESFLRNFIPEPIVAEGGDWLAAWTAERGLHWAGDAGLRVEIPLTIEIGPARFHEVGFELAFENNASLSIWMDGDLSLGPLFFGVEGLGLGIEFVPNEDGRYGAFDMEAAIIPPTSYAVTMEAGDLISVTGAVRADKQAGRYGGILNAEFVAVDITALGVLASKIPGKPDKWSLLLSLSASFGKAGIQLGAMVRLMKVGGIVGVNRTVDPEALSAGLKSGVLDSILFQDDPDRDPFDILDDIEAVFPPADGQYLFGPMVKLAWGMPTIIELDVGLIIELPEPLTITLIGSLLSQLPTKDAAIVTLKIDLVGYLNATEGTLRIDGTTNGSQVVGFALTGDVAVRAAFADERNLLVAFGGFHPDFQAPVGFPELDRMAIGLDGGKALNLSLGGYFALTSNTIQFGAFAYLQAKAIGLGVEGEVEFDALITLQPFGFVIETDFMVAVTAGKADLLAVRLEIDLEGPAPWMVAGTATVKVLGVEKPFDVEAQIGRRRDSLPRKTAYLLKDVDAAISDADSWGATVSREIRSIVTLTEESALGDDILWVHPAGAIEVSQRIAPINTDLEHCGGALLGDGPRIEIGAPMIGGKDASDQTGEIFDWFASAQFFRMSDEEKLAAPSFQEFPSGIRFSDLEIEAGAVTTCTLDYETVTRDPSVSGDEERRSKNPGLRPRRNGRNNKGKKPKGFERRRKQREAAA